MQVHSLVAEQPPSAPAGEFRSILFADADQRHLSDQPPAFFADLNLDRIVEEVISGREEYDLAPFFHTPLRELDAIEYRQEVVRDLERDEVSACIERFAGQMRQTRENLRRAVEFRYERQRQAWFLEAAALYCEAVTALRRELSEAQPRARGLRAFAEHLAGYADGEHFRTLRDEGEALRGELRRVRYRLDIQGGQVRVGRYDEEPDYSAQVAETFAKFRQGAVKDHRVRLREEAEMNHVEAALLDLVARLHPEVFASLARFCERWQHFAEPSIVGFDREVQFYLAYLDYVGSFRKAGLRFCHPQLSEDQGSLGAEETFDAALGAKLLREGESVICNDWSLDDPERVFVVSGPNQGGKTTFARTFGQLHYLASLGLPVPGREARLFVADRIFTHFERREDMTDLSGKLEDELKRVRAILGEASPHSILVMNESFGSTTLRDALMLGTEVLRRIVALGSLCVYVTFVDELASLDPSIVSVMSTVEPSDPAVRTFKVIRKPADGRAYATAIAEKYRLGYEDVKDRLS
jgi:hypothetical protein